MRSDADAMARRVTVPEPAKNHALIAVREHLRVPPHSAGPDPQPS
ncbi:MAG TPA: hypothetical protein VFO96_05550 [Gemmatimonadales bacterium]|nr:hypothetical protein [Gemmatimonadales bacterium]